MRLLLKNPVITLNFEDRSIVHKGFVLDFGVDSLHVPASGYWDRIPVLYWS